MFMKKNSQTQTLANFYPEINDVPIMPDGHRMKERLSKSPFWIKRAKKRNSAWNALGSSHINLSSDGK